MHLDLALLVGALISLFIYFSFCLQCTTITGQQCSQVPTQTCTTVYESVCDNSVGSLVNTLGRRGRREAEDETEEEEREARQLDIPANRGRTFGNIGLNANLGGGLGVGGRPSGGLGVSGGVGAGLGLSGGRSQARPATTTRLSGQTQTVPGTRVVTGTRQTCEPCLTMLYNA